MTTKTFVRIRTEAVVLSAGTPEAVADQYNSYEQGKAGDTTNTYQCRIVAFYADQPNGVFYILAEANYPESSEDPTITLPETLL